MPKTFKIEPEDHPHRFEVEGFDALDESAVNPADEGDGSAGDTRDEVGHAHEEADKGDAEGLDEVQGWEGGLEIGDWDGRNRQDAKMLSLGDWEISNFEFRISNVEFQMSISYECSGRGSRVRSSRMARAAGLFW